MKKNIQTVEAILHKAEELETMLKECEKYLADVHAGAKRISSALNALHTPDTHSPQTSDSNVKLAELSSLKTDFTIGRCERAIMIALAQKGEPCKTNLIGVLAGYSTRSGGFHNSLSKLRVNGFIAGNNDSICITEAGLQTLGQFEPHPTGEQLHKYWCCKLGKAESLILKVLIGKHPSTLNKEEIGRLTGYSHRSGGFHNALSGLRSLNLIVGFDSIKATDSLF